MQVNTQAMKTSFKGLKLSRFCGLLPSSVPLNKMKTPLLLLNLLVASFSVWAANINIPNYSFESPPTASVTIFIDSWQQQPLDFEHPTSGIFTNAPGPSFLDNCDGTQAAFLFAATQAGIFQDYDSTDYANATHSFDARFEVGKSYKLTVSITGSTNSPLNNGSTLQVALYYRDAASNMVNVASTNITYDSLAFSGVHFSEFQAALPTVGAGDAWAGRHIGISIISTASVALQGGVWDIDNVRLVSTSQPLLLNPGFSGGHFGLTLQSEPGLKFEILASADVSVARTNWTYIGTVTNVTGTVSFSDPGPGLGQRFYVARQVIP